jgi:hypothetical protein
MPAWTGSYLTTTSGSYTGNIKIGSAHVAGSPFAITSASVTVSPFRIVCGTLSSVSNLVTTATVGAPVSLTITVKDVWGSNVAFFDSVMSYSPVIPYSLCVYPAIQHPIPVQFNPTTHPNSYVPVTRVPWSEPPCMQPTAATSHTSPATATSRALFRPFP